MLTILRLILVTGLVMSDTPEMGINVCQNKHIHGILLVGECVRMVLKYAKLYVATNMEKI